MQSFDNKGETSEMRSETLRGPERDVLLSCLSILSDLVGGYDKLKSINFPLIEESGGINFARRARLMVPAALI